MLNQIAQLFAARKQNRRQSSARARRRDFFGLQRRNAQIERLEAREVMDATPHHIAAANINVQQNDPGNAATSVTITTPYSFNDFRIRGGNRADYDVQIGPSATDDVAGGILMTSIRNNGRDNGEVNSVPPEPDTAAGVQYGISAVSATATGYSIPVFNTSNAVNVADNEGIEYNFDLSAAYFPYADGWIGGIARRADGANGSATALNDQLIGSPGLTFGAHYTNTVAGQSTVDLRSMGIDSTKDGVLLVNGAKNENNFALSRANADGTWTVFVKGHNQDGTSYEQDPVAFVYAPLSNTNVVVGKFRGGANNITMQNAPFTVTNPSTGTYRLTIPGHSPADGVLIISAEGGAGNNIDNPVSFVANGNSWDIQTRDLPNMGLQNIDAADNVVSFVFIPGPTPGVNVTPSTGLLTTESGGTATFAVKLDTAPTADVTIDLSSSNTAEGTISVNQLTFTPANWNIAQNVTVTGQDDAAADGSIDYSIVTSAAVSSDPNYNNRAVVDITVTNADNEPGVTFNPPTGLTTTEAGGTRTFTVRLNTAPIADVTIGLTSSNINEGTISVPSLTFTAANWNTPQTVTITGVNDAIDDGDITYSIVTAPAVSSDPLYNNFNAPDLSVVNIDNDTAGIIVNPSTAVTLTEAGTTSNFSVVLTSQPTANVTINVVSTDTTEGTVSTGALVFTAANWNTPQTVTITGVNDLVGDGNIAFSIVTTVTTTDAIYAAMNPDDIAVTTNDNDPFLAIATGAVLYGVGTPAISIDSLMTLTDPLTANYNNYQLVVSLTANANVDDRIEIRNYGTAAGQVGVSGSNVSVGGTVVGTFAGGSGSTPLTLTLNTAATPARVQAVLRALTYRSVNANPPQTVRTASIVINGLGGVTSNVVTRNINVGLMRATELQQGVDRGTGVYDGQVDIEISQANPTTPRPAGNGTELLVDWDASGATAQILLKFGNLFGNGPGQIPLGATIVSAELLVNVINSGDGGRLFRMVSPWNENTETWNSFGSNVFPRNGIQGVNADDLEARSTADSEWGLVDGSGASGTGIVSIGVTNDLAAWANGEANEGWLIDGWTNNGDGTSFSPSEATNALLRPRLKVQWLPAGVSSTSFRQGANGYNGAQDLSLQQANADVPSSTDFTLGVDYPAPANAWQTLLRFDDLVGTNAGQIPPGSYVHAASLVLASTTGNAMGDGGAFYRMLQSWDGNSTWNSFVNGISANGVEAATTFTTQAGYPDLSGMVQGGFNPFDVTADVQAWVNGALPNNGWAVLPWTNGSDGWFFGSSEILIEKSRPTLKVFYSTPGVTITPTSGLFTSEAGDSATFTVVLDTPPTANVTIPLSSNDTTEGTIGQSSLIFTPANWNIPQTVTIAGVNDLLADGNIAYSIVTGAATSADQFYNGFNPADVSVINTDNETPGVTVQPLFGLVTNENGGTATFTIVLNFPPTANVTVGLSSSDTTEGSVPASVVFTPANWSTPQTVTVTGVNDSQIDGSVAYQIITANTVSTDLSYNNLPVADVSVTNEDNDVAGVIFTPSSGLQTTEIGGTATFTAVLATQPTADVTFNLSSSNSNEGNPSVSFLTFTSANWNVPQTVTLTGTMDGDSDGAVGYTIITSPISSSDPNYNNFNPADVTATNLDSRPILTWLEGTKVYGHGEAGVLVDFQATIVDLDSPNFNNGNLTIQTTSGTTVDDRLEIRNVGTGAGQIGISGSNVTFGGVTIGTFTGGSGFSPLVITLNSSATIAATQALLRNITFREVSSTFANSTRTISATLNDGAGSTSLPISKTIVVGMRRTTSFQNGADVGNGAYAGTADIQISQANPATAYPTGATAEGLGVVGSATAASQTLLRFDNIFGNGPGQIPLGSIITSAYLDLDVNNDGNGPVFRRMLTGWDANTSTWNSLTNGIQADDIEARSTFGSTLNNAAGTGATTGVGTVSVGVTTDLQAWSNGAANNGWAIMPFAASASDEIRFSASEAVTLADRPKLRIEWIPAGAASSSFRQGVNGYTGMTDIAITPTATAATGVDLFTDYAGSAPSSEILFRFDNIIGAGALPAGTKVYAAVLTLPGTGSVDTVGDGGTMHMMLQPWTATTTWASLGGDGVSANGFEAAITPSAIAGTLAAGSNAQPGYNNYDVTADVQSWLDGTNTNNGWAWLPWTGGTNGWGISSSETTVVTNRPMLTVYFEGVPNVAPVNTAPAGPIASFEDANVPFTGGNALSVSDADVGQSLTTTVSVTGTTVGTFTANNGGGAAVVTGTGTASITLTGLPTDITTALATLIFVPAANRDTTSGATTITMTTSDGIAIDSDTFNVTLTGINDRPSFTATNPPAVNEDAAAVSIANWAVFNPGPNETSQTVVSYNITNLTNTSLFSAGPTIGTNGTLQYTPAANAFGTATFDLTVTDSGGNANGGQPTSTVQSFTITVNSVNDAPSFTKGADQNVAFNAPQQTITGWASSISFGPANEGPQTVTFLVTPANPALFLTQPAIDSTGTLTFRPQTGASGSTTVTVIAQDNGGGTNQSASQTFTITIGAAPTNAPPTLTAISNLTINEDAGLQTVNLSGISYGGDTPAQTIAITAVSDNPSLIANPAVNYTSPNATGSLTFTPVANQSGTATITVTVRDSGLDLIAGNSDDGTVVRTFTVTVNSVNDAPTLTIGGNQTMNEDAPAQTVNGFVSSSSAGPSNESTQTLTYIVNATNSALFATAPSISATGVLTYTPAANANGVSTITVTAVDNGGTANTGVDTSTPQVFTITINSVNDAPSFTKGSDLLIPFNSPAQTIPGWATAISPGAPNESTETLTFTVTNNNPSLFSVAPAISSNGTLTFTHQPGQQGSATITVRLNDNGGIANGGVDQSATQTFVITVDAPVNGLPTINAIPNLPLLEDAGAQTINLGGITAGGEVQDLQVTATSSNPTLIANPTVTYASPGTTGSLAFTPVANGSGTSVITITVRDAGFNLTLGDADDGITTTTFTVNVAAVNDPPDASDGSFTTLAGNPVSGTLVATDVDGPALTFSLVNTPLLGGLTSFNPATGAFTYTPAPNAVGLDIFTFRVTDGTNSDTATVRITIQPIVPTVEAVGGDLNIRGTPGSDNVIVSKATGNNALVRLQSGSYSMAATLPLTGMIHVETGAGADTIMIAGLTGPTYLDAGPDNDYVSGAMGDDTIIGGSGSDQINASGGNNVIWGDVPGEQNLAAGGDDILSSLDGNDVMYGGGGNDQLFPGAGDDYVYGGQGDDISSGGMGNDRLYGGSGNDVLNGDAGDDIVVGNAGNDLLMGSEGNDLLIGGTGLDDVNGNGGSDVLVGSSTTNETSSLAGDANDLALLALLTTWNTSHTPGLLSSVIAADDGANDLLNGQTGDDDFYASATDLLSDINASAMGTDRLFN
ncbi:DNRLRE domain-containing protein [Anatilimnocola floriformis]|uniref:DNRLRE domain-containing protein n=1 Tax=Anatilimnocola floriformis TaxID=2948575 RepID=UPI0020C4C5B2|nr:DNRLRE domain-containing protein [Anatilimnocola floriformis]